MARGLRGFPVRVLQHVHHVRPALHGHALEDDDQGRPQIVEVRDAEVEVGNFLKELYVQRVFARA